MAATLPSADKLGIASVQPTLGTASYRGATGEEGTAARAIAGAGNEFGNTAQFLYKAQDEHDRMSAEDALNKVRADFIKQQFDEKDGWAGKLGEAATNPEFIKQKLESFQGSIDKIGSTLSPGAQRYFRPQADASRMHSEASFYGHVSQQRIQQDLNIFTSGRQLILDRVARMPTGPQGDAEQAAAIDELRVKSEQFALRRGFSPEEATALANANITDVIVARVNGALAINRPDEAKRIFDENGKLLGQKGIDALQKKVTDAYTHYSVLKIANEETDRVDREINAATSGIPPGGVGPVKRVPGEEQGGPSSGGTPPPSAWPVRAESTITPEQQREGRGRRQDTPQFLPDPTKVFVPPAIEAALMQVSGGDTAKQAFLRSVLTTENAGFGEVRSDKVSPAGAAGPFQFMTGTALEYGLSPAERADPMKSAAAASKFYDWLNNKYQGNRMAMAAHYNGGTLAGEAVMRGNAPPAAETRNYLAMFARADSGAPGATGGFFPGGFQTSRVKMIQERQGEILASTRARLEKEFPNNPEAVQLGLQRAQSLIGAKINAENGIQQGNLNEITTTILNTGADSLAALLAVPGMPEKLSTAGPYMQHIISLMNLVGHQKNGNADFKGNSTLHYALTQKVLTGEIKKDTDLLPYLGDPSKGASGLSLPQLHDLQNQIGRLQRPESRDRERELAALNPSAQGSLRAYITTKLNLYPQMPGHDIVLGDSISQWHLMARREVARAEATGDPKAVEALFDPTSPKYLVSPKRVDEIVKLSQQMQAPDTVVIPASAEEIAQAPTLKGKVREKDPAFIKAEPAVLTAAGWKGGWVKDASGRLFQKMPKRTTPNG